MSLWLFFLFFCLSFCCCFLTWLCQKELLDIVHLLLQVILAITRGKKTKMKPNSIIRFSVRTYYLHSLHIVELTVAPPLAPSPAPPDDEVSTMDNEENFSNSCQMFVFHSLIPYVISWLCQRAKVCPQQFLSCRFQRTAKPNSPFLLRPLGKSRCLGFPVVQWVNSLFETFDENRTEKGGFCCFEGEARCVGGNKVIVWLSEALSWISCVADRPVALGSSDHWDPAPVWMSRSMLAVLLELILSACWCGVSFSVCYLWHFVVRVMHVLLLILVSVLIYRPCAAHWPPLCVVWFLRSRWKKPRRWDCECVGVHWQWEKRPAPSSGLTV